MDKIDNLDKKILSILSQNARIPFKDVAAECGVSRAAIHQRVQHLIEGGIITGSGFDINPKSLGYSTCTYVGLNLERGSMYKDVVQRLLTIPEIVECHFTTGPYTMLVKLYAQDNEQLMDLLNNKMQSIPGVVSTETLISLEQSIKRELPAPFARRGPRRTPHAAACAATAATRAATRRGPTSRGRQPWRHGWHFPFTRIRAIHIYIIL